MPVPSTQEIRKPLLEVFKDEAPHSFVINNFLKLMADEFGEITTEMSSIEKTTFKNNINEAKTFLNRNGLLSRPSNTIYMITTTGLEVLEENPEVIDDKYLAMRNKLPDTEPISLPPVIPVVEEPEQQLEPEPVIIEEVITESEPEPEPIEEFNPQIEEVEEVENVEEEEKKEIEEAPEVYSEEVEEIQEEITEQPEELLMPEDDREEIQELQEIQETPEDFVDEEFENAEEEFVDTEEIVNEAEPELESEEELEPQEEIMEPFEEVEEVEKVENIEEPETIPEQELQQQPQTMPESVNDYDEDLIQTQSLEEVFKKYNADLTNEVLEKVAAIPSDRFEMLVIDLLSKMGYRAFQNARYTTEAEGSELIHGVILENRAGMTPIYIQARKLSPSKTIGRSDMKDFIAAIQDKGGKGLFATTANFSEQAVIAATDERIMLIDGKRLASLMISNNFCVNVEKIFEVKSIDLDSFSEYEN